MKRTQSLLNSLLPPKVVHKAEDNETVWKTSRIVQLATRFNFLWSNCLRRSLVLWFLLCRQGIESKLHIGVKQEEGQFAAHAWVEWNNIPLNDSLTVRQEFTVFDDL